MSDSEREREPEKNQSMGHAGRASGCNAGGEKVIARELVLKVAMHCRCEGCTPKVSSALNNLTLATGVVAVLERSATEATGRGGGLCPLMI